MKIYNRDVKSRSVNRFRRLKDGRIFDNDVGKMFNMDTPNNRVFVKNLQGSDGDFLRRELARQDNGIWRNPGRREPGPMRNPIVRKRASLQDAKVIPTPVKQEPTQRMAGDVIPEGLDSLLSEIREEGREELKQEAIVQMMRPEVSVEGLMNGTSRTAEQQVARDLLFRGEMPDALPADLYSASDLADRSELGIAGPYQSDSAIRQSTTGGLNSKGELEVSHLPVRTEFLTEGTQERLFDAWQNLNGNTKRSMFNADVGEYYGQQALKLVGATPVSDANRSTKVRQGIRKSPGQRPEPLPTSQSTAGTDRLIENSTGILSPDIDLSGDYRYMMDGDVRVGDYQTGNPLDTVRLNVLKQVQGPGTSSRAIKENWANTERALKAQGITPNPLEVIDAMVRNGQLPEKKRGSFGVGIRGGKSLSASPMFRDENREDQFRYDDILFGHTNQDRRNKAYGYIPEELVLVNNRKAINSLGNRPSDVMVMGGTNQQKEVNVLPRIDDLIAAGAAERISDRPLVRQLFG